MQIVTKRRRIISNHFNLVKSQPWVAEVNEIIAIKETVKIKKPCHTFFIPISSNSGLKIDGLSTVGYNVGDLVFTGNFDTASCIITRVQETVEG